MNSKSQPTISRDPQKKLHIASNNLFKKYHKEFSFQDVDIVLTKSINFNYFTDSLNIFLISEEYVNKNENILNWLLKKKANNCLLFYIGDSGINKAMNKHIDIVVPEPANVSSMQKSVEIGSGRRYPLKQPNTIFTAVSAVVK